MSGSIVIASFGDWLPRGITKYPIPIRYRFQYDTARRKLLERSEWELQRLARETAELSISLTCGYVGKAPEDAGKRATDSAAILQRGQIVFRRTKMLLPASAAAASRAMQKLPHLSDSDVDELDAALAAGRVTSPDVRSLPATNAIDALMCEDTRMALCLSYFRVEQPCCDLYHQAAAKI